MNAQKANELSMSSCKEEINQILKKIDTAAKAGATKLNVGYHLKGGTIAFLQNEEGYSIRIDTKGEYIIRW